MLNLKIVFATLINVSGLSLFSIGLIGVTGKDLATAQLPPLPTSQQSLQEFQQPNQSGFSTGSNGTGLNLFQLLQNSNFLSGKSAGEVGIGQKESLDEASVEFRKQQRQKLNVVNPILVEKPNPKK